MDAYTTIGVTPATANIGAVVDGVDAQRPLPAEQVAELHDALARHLVLFLRGQELSDEQHVAFASRFGPLNPSAYRPGGLDWLEDTADSPPKTDLWHTDVAFLPEPPDFAVINCLVTPPVGGDTLWASLYAAHDALSPVLQDLVAGLELDVRPALASVPDAGQTVRHVVYRPNPDAAGERQPLVRVHPVTGRRALFLCGAFMHGIVGMHPEESEVLLGLLRRGLDDPNVQCRWRWQPHDLAIWDERCTNHRAVADHYPARRVVRRCTVGSSRPVGRVAARTTQSGL